MCEENARDAEHPCISCRVYLGAREKHSLLLSEVQLCFLKEKDLFTFTTLAPHLSKETPWSSGRSWNVGSGHTLLGSSTCAHPATTAYNWVTKNGWLPCPFPTSCQHGSLWWVHSNDKLLYFSLSVPTAFQIVDLCQLCSSGRELVYH